MDILLTPTSDSPWVDSMSPSTNDQYNGGAQARDLNPPTVAAFSPSTIAGSSQTSRQRSSVIVHRKSPLLVATPPPVTRALAYSHPFLLPLNKFVGLVSWSSGDPWQSFLLVAGFWAVVLYGDAIILWAGPVLVVLALILGMWSRRYSPLSSTGFPVEKQGHKRQPSEASSARHHKSLDEIVETLREFTTRCNILLGPLRDMTNFLSTQSSPTSATTRPALTALFIRILCVLPLWILLTLPPFYIITTRRVILVTGTIILTYHSRPARVSRVILWRSLTVRRICSFLTGLNLSDTSSQNKDGSGSKSSFTRNKHAMSIAASKHGDTAGVRFTFILYENQRRWLGIGWSYSLFPTERSPWTDEHLNTAPPKDKFELPEGTGGNAVWRWVEGSEWKIDGADDSRDGGGWIYYDNKWQDGRRGQDGWGRYTRRRKWYRDAELVEVDEKTVAAGKEASGAKDSAEKSTSGITAAQEDATSINSASTARRRKWFGGSKSSKASVDLASTSGVSTSSNVAPDVSTGGDNESSAQRPVPHSRALSTESGVNSVGATASQKSNSSSRHRRRESNNSPSIGDGDSSLSVRSREMDEAHDRLDHWGARATGGTERAERELGLGDDVNMGLS